MKPDFRAMLVDLTRDMAKSTLSQKIGIAENTLDGYLEDIKDIPAQWYQGYKLTVLWLEKNEQVTK